MSYILDALKKAEHDRAIGQVPGIGSEHEPAARHGTGRWVWVLLAVLLVNAVLLAALLWPDDEPGLPPEVVAQKTEPPSLRYEPPAAPPAVAVPQVAARTPPVAVPPRQNPAPLVDSDMPQPAVALRPLPALPESVSAGSTGVPTDTDRVPPRPSAAVSTAARSYNNLPVWPQISGQLLSELNGSLHLDVHVYSNNPAERFVLINMRKYRTGERVQEGPVVDEITPDSVILSLNGQRFRMQSQ